MNSPLRLPAARAAERRGGFHHGLLSLAAGATLACAAACGESEAARPAAAQILWDDYGVPHVRAPDDEGLMRAFGWAQARSHGDMLLRLLGQARGRAAELWGQSFLDSDRAVWTAGIPERARSWYDAQDPAFRLLLDAFAQGINDYAREHGGNLDDIWERALPVDAVDVLAHTQRVLHFGFVAGTASEAQALLQRGSNGWAVAPSRSSTGHALLVANPHLPWSEPWLLYEAQLESPNLQAYGAAFVGFPVLGIAFNEDLGWTHTVNPHDGADLYELTLVEGGYLWDDGVRSFETTRQRLRVRKRGGGFEEVEHVVQHSLHGPVVAQSGARAVARRVVGLDRPHALRQWWDMGRARDLEAFERALAQEQIPTFTVIYADRAGHVLHQFGGLTPVRAQAQLDWGGLVPGNGAATLWTQVHAFAELPRVLDPSSGWVHNANDPPWSATVPCALDPADFPPYMAPRFLHLAAQRSARLLREADLLSLEQAEALPQDTGVELAERVLPDLLELVQRSGSASAREAALVLERWDRRLDAESRGAVLFATFFQLHQAGGSAFVQPWDPARPLETPRGLAGEGRALDALEQAARTLRESFGSLDVAWGEVYRLRWAGLDLPCSGGMRSLGLLRAFEFAAEPDGRRRAVSGEAFVAAVEFSQPLRARVRCTYGNASQPGSPHAADQLDLAARGELRDAWLTSEQIEAHLRERELVPAPRTRP